MLPPTNELWCHGLPRRRNASSVRLNLTFRQMLPSHSCSSTSQNKSSSFDISASTPILSDESAKTHSDSSLSCDHVLPSSNNSYIINQHSEHSSAFCAHSSKSYLPVIMKRSGEPSSVCEKKVRIEVCTSTMSSGFSVDNLPPHHFSLGGNKFVKVTDFTGSIRVHIRNYEFRNDRMYPTKCGVTMSAHTFKVFMNNIHQYEDMNDMKIINKSLFLCGFPATSGTEYIFQQLARVENGAFQLLPLMVSVNREQFEKLIDVCSQVWDSITQLIFCPTFKECVKSLQCDDANVPSEDEELFLILTEVLTAAVQDKIGTIYDCRTCRLPLDEQPNNQLGHECAMFTLQEKLRFGFEEALSLVDSRTLADSFVKEVGSIRITDTFLDHLDVKNTVETARNML